MSIRFPNIYLYSYGSNLARQNVSRKNNVHILLLHFVLQGHLATERDEKGAKPLSMEDLHFKDILEHGRIQRSDRAVTTY